MEIITTGSRRANVDAAAGALIGDIAAAVAEAHEIPGTTFTLKRDGEVLDPTSTLADSGSDTTIYELIEHVEPEVIEQRPIDDTDPHAETIVVDAPGKAKRQPSPAAEVEHDDKVDEVAPIH